MGRQTSTPTQIPGAPPTDAADTAAGDIGADAPDVGAAPAAADGQTVFTTGKGRKATHEEKDAIIAELQAKLAESQRLPQVVYEPKTPHGKEALAASNTAHMTVKQVIAAIDAGEMKEPLNSTLCSDGYYVRRT